MYVNWMCNKKGGKTVMRMLEAKSISFRYSGQTPNDSGKCYLVFGSRSNNCTYRSFRGGKSTLGYCLSGVIPTLIKGEFSGRITRQGRIGIVFQDADAQVFLPTVEDELAFGPENLCLPRQEIEDRINGILELLNIEELRLKNPARLSGGQKQLVALGGVLNSGAGHHHFRRDAFSIGSNRSRKG
jgi:energy-coupling factor transporter ATP-binding protein EcfA2